MFGSVFYERRSILKTINEVIQFAQQRPNKTIAVACPDDFEVLEAVAAAKNLNLCDFILFGRENQIRQIGKTVPGLNLDELKIVNVEDPTEACMEAVKSVSSKEADVLMKGLVDTAVILKQVLNKEYGLRTESILSHVMIMELPKFDRLIFLSDGAMNINPTVEELKSITLNAVSLARSLDIECPKVACLSAIEKVNPKMPSSEIAREMQTMNENDEITNCVVRGPLAVDLALDQEAAKIKNITHEVAGQADILIAPYIEVANALYKGWMFGCLDVKSAGIIVGARAPIVLTSRADSYESKLNSIALSVLMKN